MHFVTKVLVKLCILAQMSLTGAHPTEHDDDGHGRVNERRVGFGERDGHGPEIGDGGLIGQIGLAAEHDMHAGRDTPGRIDISIIVMMAASPATANSIDGISGAAYQVLQLLSSVGQPAEDTTRAVHERTRSLSPFLHDGAGGVRVA